ncbi:response regulator [Caballeronia sp. LZ001]|uniref:response regulator n=1 Tax=Caballeronia sp. LZ001 TaxID=3038553 RepID=UPI00285B239F|nr:response regulator [Caballeronia sp. LZ001]MDR5806539.1 response regulator [Caballeronia sp. LZ001]
MPSSKTYARRWTSRFAVRRDNRLRVLVVDDNANAADAFTAYFGLFGTSSKAAYGGASAICTALEWVPNVVFLDISMPELDGFAVARRFRSEPLLKDVVIVALTAHDEAFVQQRAPAGDFDGYCQKGNPATALVELLEQLTAEV